MTYGNCEVAAQQVTVNGLVTSERTQTGLVTTTAYDSFQRKISVTAPRTGTTTFTYHTAVGKIGMLASETDAAGNTTTYDYDAAGHVIKRTDVCDKSCSLEDIADNLRNGPLRHSQKVTVGGSLDVYRK